MNPWYPERYFAYGPLLRRKFGARVYKVSVNGGFTCPNRDGNLASGGCTYCNNESFRPDGAKPTLSVTRQIEGGISFLRKRFGAEKFIAYFQSYTGTYASSERLASLYREALSHPEVVGLSIGTRPDCLGEETLRLLEDLASRCYLTLELGLESVHDRTLSAINRGHDFAAWVDAVRRSTGRGFALATHVILGLPGESRREMLQSADVVSALPIDFIKIHHLHVVRGTAMARDYRLQAFPTFSLPEYADLLCDYLERLSPRVCIQRLFGLAPEAMILAPRWNLTKDQTLAALKQHMEKRNTWQGKVPAGARAGIGSV